VARAHVESHYIAEKRAEYAGGFGVDCSRRRYVNGIVAESRHYEVLEQEPAVGMRIGAHAACARGRDARDLRNERAIVIEQFFGAVALHPLLEQRDMSRIIRKSGDRYLMRAERSLRLLPVDELGARPALGRTQHDHRPWDAMREAVLARFLLDALDVRQNGVHGGSHELVHHVWVVSGDETRIVPVASQQRRQLVVADSRENGRTCDLVAVEMQDRNNRAVPGGIEEFVRMPACRERACFCLTIPDCTTDEEIRIVEYGAIRVQQRISQLSAFMYGSRCFRSDVTGYAARKRELLEKALQTSGVATYMRIDLAVRPLEVGVGDDTRSAVAWTGDENRVDVVLPDQPVHVHVHEVQSGCRTPVAEQPALDVVEAQRCAQERIGEEIDLADGEVVRGAPVGVYQPELIHGKWIPVRRFIHNDGRHV